MKKKRKASLILFMVIVFTVQVLFFNHNFDINIYNKLQKVQNNIHTQFKH